MDKVWYNVQLRVNSNQKSAQVTQKNSACLTMVCYNMSIRIKLGLYPIFRKRMAHFFCCPKIKEGEKEYGKMGLFF